MPRLPPELEPPPPATTFRGTLIPTIGASAFTAGCVGLSSVAGADVRSPASLRRAELDEISGRLSFDSELKCLRTAAVAPARVMINTAIAEDHFCVLRFFIFLRPQSRS